MILIVLLAALVALIVYAAHYAHGYWARRGIPHDKPKMPGGNFSDWPKKKQFSQIFKDYYMKYKDSDSPFAGFFFFFTKTVIITDLDLIKNILIKDFNNFDSRGIFFNERDDPLSATLFSIEGHQWRQLRHKLSPTFTSGKMKHMFPTVLGVGQKLLLVFGEHVKKADGSALEITNIVGRYTADVIGTCAFGLDCNSLTNPEAEFVTWGRRALTERSYGGKLDFLVFGFPKLARFLRMRTTVKEVEDFYTRIVRQTIDYREKNNIKRNDFMEMLIEMKKKHDAGDESEGLSFKELTAQAFIFFLAGFETSSTTMGFALYELAKNQEIQTQLHKEINEVLKKHNNEFTYEAMKEMHYLEQVIYETLRMYPVLGQLNRITQKRYDTGNPKYYIEAGTVVVVSAWGIHLNPDIYPEPEKFKPERFTPEEIQARPACTWLPFGDGPRNCIGLRFGLMQTCIGLTYLIKNFKFSVAPETEMPLKLDQKNILLNAVNGIYLKVETTGGR